MVDWSGGAVGPGIGSDRGGEMAGARYGSSIDDIGAWYAANIDPNLSQASTGTSLADLMAMSETEGELQANLASILGTMGQGGLSQNYGPLSGQLGLEGAAHLANISNQKSPFNQQLENFAQVIGKTAQTLSAQDMQAFDAAVRSGTSDAGPLGTSGQGGVSQNYGRFSGGLGPSIALNTNPTALAAVDAQRAHLKNITTQKSPFNQELENFALTLGKTGQTLNTRDMQAYDKAVRAGQSFATAPGINYGSYDDEGMSDWSGFGYMDPTQGPANMGWDAGEFARLSGEEQADAEALRAEGGGEYLLPRKKPKRAYTNAFEGVARPKKKRNIYQDSASMGWN